MAVKLSSTKIESFCGDVLPLHLHFDTPYHDELKKARIEWSCDGAAVDLRSFSGEDEMCFHNGVLLILKEVGRATVTARLCGEEYCCDVTVREMKHASTADELHYYVGDLHVHTSTEHDHDKFAARQSGFQSEYVDYLKGENLLDFSVISDHASTTNDTDFFRGFTAVENAEPMDTVILPGSESEAVIREHDRFGILHQNGGEIVTLNTAGYGSRTCWEDFEQIYEGSPMPVAIFAHPQVIGYSTPGMWNFQFKRNNRPEMLRVIRGIEMGDGAEARQNLIHEYAYSDALDAGFRVSTTCSSDSHGTPPGDGKTDRRWGYYRFPGKTVIMAPEKSKEAFIDALRSNRFYATENGNVKLRYTVNGMTAPADLPSCDTYAFHVEVSYFQEEPAHVPVSCRVISDGGEMLLELRDVDFSSFDFEICSRTARYFFLRFIDARGFRTWSTPVWTGRAFDRQEEAAVTPIDMRACSAKDLTTGKDAAALIDGDPLNNWEAENDAPSILIDMKREREICALGNYPRTFDRKRYAVKLSTHSMLYTAGIPTLVAVSVSRDGKHFEQVAEARCRAFGAEQIISFPRTRARYVRFDVLSTVGRDNLPKKYGGTKVGIANISLFS